MAAHYRPIWKYAHLSVRNLYSFGWLLDIARCVYTLRTGEIVSKTAAGEWTVEIGLFPDPAPLVTALKVRKEPRRFWEDTALQDMSETLNGDVQRYADVLEEELKRRGV